MMHVRVDWSKRAEYIRTGHGVDPEWADEAVSDDHAVWINPDPASRSGLAVRVGYSARAAAVLTVILLDSAADPAEQPDGRWWGSNAWPADGRDRRWYGEVET